MRTCNKLAECAFSKRCDSQISRIHLLTSHLDARRLLDPTVSFCLNTRSWRANFPFAVALQRNMVSRSGCFGVQMVLRKHRIGLLILVATLTFAGCNRQPTHSETVRVAVAANFNAAQEKLAARFTQQTGISVESNYGATGALYSQIANGAPFQVFLSADADRPEQLEKEGLAAPGSRRRCATPPPAASRSCTAGSPRCRSARRRRAA